MFMESSLDPTPKLSLYSFPGKISESPGMATPPIYTLASVPFQWEEAPGKPRLCTAESCDKVNPVRCLELPPRLSVEAKVANLPSPITVLEGPYLGRSLSLGKERFSETGRVRKEKSVFASSRWGSFRKHNTEGDEEEDLAGGTTVKITRIKRRSSFLSFSNKRSHLWTNICESIKQVVQWRRRRED